MKRWRGKQGEGRRELEPAKARDTGGTDGATTNVTPRHTGHTHQRVMPRLEGGVIREGLLVELHQGRLVGGPVVLLEVV